MNNPLKLPSLPNLQSAINDYDMTFLLEKVTALMPKEVAKGMLMLILFEASSQGFSALKTALFMVGSLYETTREVATEHYKMDINKMTLEEIVTVRDLTDKFAGVESSSIH